ncbi:MAG: hypothetical protein JST17_08390 [Bacteroidetes bacterium]|nr:hypothetical protein [Bacteroidota bacterium]MBS1930806.1 hypothetical protein [Bacteroidota bacterium]
MKHPGLCTKPGKKMLPGISLFSVASNDFTIITLSDTQLVVSFPYTPPSGSTVQLVVTFIH